MKIKSNIACWTPHPETSWSVGEIREVSNEVGNKLLLNNNFVKVSDTKPEIEDEKEKDERHRKKRSIRDRS